MFHEVLLLDRPIWIEPNVNHDILEVSVWQSHSCFQLAGEFLEVLRLPVELRRRVVGDWAVRCAGYCAGVTG